MWYFLPYKRSIYCKEKILQLQIIQLKKIYRFTELFISRKLNQSKNDQDHLVPQRSFKFTTYQIILYVQFKQLQSEVHVIQFEKKICPRCDQRYTLLSKTITFGNQLMEPVLTRWHKREIKSCHKRIMVFDVQWSQISFLCFGLGNGGRVLMINGPGFFFLLSTTFVAV